jgi:hypothetical protein
MPTKSDVMHSMRRITIMLGMNNLKYAEISRKIREIPLEKHGASYEWEELVQKLCASDDAGLHEIGIKELGELISKHVATNKK